MYDRQRVRRRTERPEAPAEPTVEHVASPLLQLQRTAGNQATAAALRVGEADSPAEREADAVAAQVAGNLRRSSNPAPAAPSPGLAGMLRRARGGGQEIDEATRARLAPAVAGDLADVRLHTDATAARMSAELGARAFASGQDVFFGAGERQSGGDALLAHEAAHATQDVGGDVVHRFPANVLSTPNTGWAKQVGGAFRPGEGVSGGVFILSAADQEDPVKKVVVKPVYAGKNGVGNEETGEQLSFADKVMSSILGISAPASRVVNAGTLEFAELLNVCKPYAPTKPTDPEQAEDWKDLALASSFIVMGEVPNAKTLSSFAGKAGEGDTESFDVLSKAVFDPDFLAQLGRLSVGDLLLGNNDRMVAGGMNLGNMMVSMVDGKAQLHAIDSLAMLDNFDPKEFLKKGSASSNLQGGFQHTKSTFDEHAGNERINAFFEVLVRQVRSAQPTSEEALLTPADVLEMQFLAGKEKWFAAFDKGFQQALEDIKALIESKEGRGKLKELTGEHEGTKLEGKLSYTALKANATYLAGRSEGKGHDEVKQDGAAVVAVKELSKLNPAAFGIPTDEFHYNHMPRLSGSAATADLEEIRSLPSPAAINQTTDGAARNRKSVPARLQSLGRATQAAKAEVDELGTKSRGVLKKKDTVRNRQYAGYAVADSYLLGAGSLRAASQVNDLTRVASLVEVAAASNLKPSQAQAILPAVRGLIAARDDLGEGVANYVEALGGASKDVGKLKKYNGRAKVVDALGKASAETTRIGAYLGDIDALKPEDLLEAILAKSRG